MGRTKHGKKPGQFQWDVDNQTIETGALDGVETIIHLAGAGVADKRWSKARKQEILDSRVLGSRLLYNELKKGNHQVKAVISASAIGFYGFNDNTIKNEYSNSGTGFLAEVTKAWEQEVDQIASLGIRVVKIRIGIVLSTQGGAYKELIKPIQFYVGSPLGTGTQLMSWIHQRDLTRLFVLAVTNHSMQGVYNGVTGQPVSNAEFTKSLAHLLQRKIWLPNVPAFVLNLILGEMASMILGGNHIVSSRLEEAGFKPEFTGIDAALADLVSQG